METQTDFRNYFELQPGATAVGYSPDHFCCAYIDTLQYLGEKLFAAEGISPLVMSREEIEGDCYTFVFCRVQRQDVGRFIEVMEQLKALISLKYGDDYALYCQTFLNGLDGRDDMLELFKTKIAQLGFRVIK